MQLRNDQRCPGFVYVMRSSDPAWYNRIKVGLSVDPIARSKQLHSTGVPYPFFPYHVWAVTDMAYAEAMAHYVLYDHRIFFNREHFEVIPSHRFAELFGSYREPEDFEIISVLDTLVDIIDTKFECSNLAGYYSVNLEQLGDYSHQRKKTNRNPNNPEAYRPLF